MSSRGEKKRNIFIKVSKKSSFNSRVLKHTDRTNLMERKVTFRPLCHISAMCQTVYFSNTTVTIVTRVHLLKPKSITSMFKNQVWTGVAEPESLC